jgi:hypothetical protein
MDAESKAMFDILNKLQNANPKLMEAKVEEATVDLVEKSKRDPELQFAMTQKIDESSVTVQNYRIDIVLNEFAGREKRFYNIVETSTNRIIHQELALFETAMGIVKKYMTGKSGVQELENFDSQYSAALYEVWSQNDRVKRGINEDIAIAKADAAKKRVVEAKAKIIKRI